MEKMELPKGWVKTKIGNIVDYGRVKKIEFIHVAANTWVLELEDIEKDTSKILKKIYVSDRPFKSTKNTFSAGDVLYGKLRPYLNKVCLADDDGVCSTEIIPINAEPSTSNKYLFFWLKSNAFLNYVNQVSYGVNMPRLGTADGKNAPFILSPLAEQQEIVRIVESHLKLVEQIKRRLDALSKKLEQFRQSVLAAAMSGKLTEEWRHENKKPDFTDISWEEILRDKKNSFKRGPFGSSLTKSMFVEKGYKVYEQYCPINDDCSYVRYYITPEKFEEMRAFEVLDGDFLISCSGSLGRITQVPKGSDRGIINQALLRVRLNHNLYNDTYFKIVFRSPSFQKELFNNSTGSAVPNLKSVKDLKQMRLPIPTLKEQQEIVQKVDQLFALADQIEASIKNAQKRGNLLTQSILAKAFRGELTAKWREENSDLISGENSAEALLARIQAEKRKHEKN